MSLSPLVFLLTPVLIIAMANRPPTPELSLSDLVKGAEKVLENAVELRAEAEALRKVGALSRALFLFQISMEECAKIDLLGVHATSVLMGNKVKAGKLLRPFDSHKSKNYINAYMLAADEAERGARREKRWDDARNAFKERQKAFHEDSNTAKNASLYVDLVGSNFLAPKERVTDEMVAAIDALNEEFVEGCRASVRVMQGWEKNPDRIRKVLEGFEAILPKQREGEDVDALMTKLMDEVRRRMREA